MLDAIAGNLLSFSCVGSGAAHFERYKVPVEALQKHGKPQVRRWSQLLLKDLDEQGRIDRDREAEFAGLTGFNLQPRRRRLARRRYGERSAASALLRQLALPQGLPPARVAPGSPAHFGVGRAERS